MLIQIRRTGVRCGLNNVSDPIAVDEDLYSVTISLCQFSSTCKSWPTNVAFGKVPFVEREALGEILAEAKRFRNHRIITTLLYSSLTMDGCLADMLMPSARKSNHDRKLLPERGCVKKQLFYCTEFLCSTKKVKMALPN